jgi:SAM-dependent methyltransferase
MHGFAYRGAGNEIAFRSRSNTLECAMGEATKRRARERDAGLPIEPLTRGTRSILRPSRGSIAPGGDPIALRRDPQPKYVLGSSTPERERLLKQCELFEPEARWMLDQIGVRPDWWTVDIGCGPLGVLNVLAEYAGPGAQVVGLERDVQMVTWGRELLAERGLESVILIQGDARDTGLPPAGFDLAHARLLLVNVPEPEEVVAEMVRIVRPGGWIALEEVDWITWMCEPHHPSWTRLLEVNAAIWRGRGMDVNIGRRLPPMLQRAGLTDIRCRTHTPVFGHDDEHKHLLLAFSRINRDEIIDTGYMTEAEFDKVTASLQAHLADPGTFVTWSLFCQTWGRKAA